MIEATLCPSILYCPSATHFEVQKMCDKIADIWSLGKEYEVKYVIPVDIFDSIANGYPWRALENGNNNELRRCLLDTWNCLSSCLFSFPIVTQKSNTICSCSYDNAFQNWLGFLIDWGKTSSVKGIVTEYHCPHSELEKVSLAKNGEDWRYIKYPWLLKSDKRLPTKGKYPYVPPLRWKSASSLSTMDGGKLQYVDASGDFWCWDMKHKNHWDVTNHITGKHKNVTVDGVILTEE